jgi:hypothetical protein
MSKPGPTPTEEQQRERVAREFIISEGWPTNMALLRSLTDLLATREAAAELRGRIAGLREAFSMTALEIKQRLAALEAQYGCRAFPQECPSCRLPETRCVCGKWDLP